MNVLHREFSSVTANANRLLFLACPLPDLFDEETNSSKRARIDHIPMPPLPPAATYTPPAQLIVPQ
ncbi:hypothetical protein WUBG_18977, partial [Wuchereria bancrofti]